MLEHSLEKNESRREELLQETALGRFIAVIEDRPFLRECFRRSIQLVLELPVIGFSSVVELDRENRSALPRLVILSRAESSKEAIAAAVHSLTRHSCSAPFVFLSDQNDPDLARMVISSGAKGWIPATMRFDIAIEALRFILAGGTYVPMDYVLEPGPRSPNAIAMRRGGRRSPPRLPRD